MARQLGLPAALARWGLLVETVPGWDKRGDATFAPKGALCHWTAGPPASTKRPSLRIVTEGRSDLAGPLCHVYLARDGVAVVVASGRANHAGAGDWLGIKGNSSLFGTEAEAAGPSDFTDAQRWAYPRVNAAFAELGGFTADKVAGHSEYALPRGRKVDINAYPMTHMREQVAALLAAGPHASEEDDDVKLTDLIESRLPQDLDRNGKGKSVTLAELLQNIQVRADAGANQTVKLDALDTDLRADLAAKGQQITALTAAIGALTKGTTVTEAQVYNAVGRALSEAGSKMGAAK